jgi:hypothetical protein
MHALFWSAVVNRLVALPLVFLIMADVLKSISGPVVQASAISVDRGMDRAGGYAARSALFLLSALSTKR